jgi:hypothetical protein
MSIRPTVPVLVLPALHVALCIIAQFAYGDSGSWMWFPFLFIDFPVSVLLMMFWNIGVGNIGPGWFVFGVFGTLWWYFISALIRSLYLKYEERP